MNYIILELIPTTISIETGNIIQLSALKINDLNLIDRFDYRLSEDKIQSNDFKELISYDKESFKYVDTTKEILDKFKCWCEDYTLLILDNPYTRSYLKDIENTKENILDRLNLEYSDEVIDNIIKKYKLQPSNYIVDILYEGLIYESNNKK